MFAKSFIFTKKTTLLVLRILEKIIANQTLHYKWLNTLSYMEYIGTRKIIKSLPAFILDKAFLSHVHEEVRHSLFFKNIAQQLAQKNLKFEDSEMLASNAGKNYFQQIDHHTAKFCSSESVMCYLYTTYVVEQRAVALYLLYHAMLKKRRFSFHLQSVLYEEKQHLNYVLEEVQKADPKWEKHLEDMQHFEHQKFFSFLIALEREIIAIPLMETAYVKDSQKLYSSQYSTTNQRSS